MADYQNLRLAIKDGVLTITINRPKSLNALNQQTLQELSAVIDELPDNTAIKGVILTGAGDKAFVAGADISEFTQLNELNGRKFAEIGQDIFRRIESCAKPIIAAVNGYALGGGSELAMACHLRVATANAVFGQPEVNLGIIPGFGGTQRMTQLIGKGRALEFMLTGQNISAKEALQCGLVNHVVENPEELLPKCQEIMAKIMAKAPVAVGLVIESVNAVWETEDGYQVEANNFGACCKTHDFKEGAQAFKEKRKPHFKGE